MWVESVTGVEHDTAWQSAVVPAIGSQPPDFGGGMGPTVSDVEEERVLLKRRNVGSTGQDRLG